MLGTVIPRNKFAGLSFTKVAVVTWFGLAASQLYSIYFLSFQSHNSYYPFKHWQINSMRELFNKALIVNYLFLFFCFRKESKACAWSGCRNLLLRMFWGDLSTASTSLVAYSARIAYNRICSKKGQKENTTQLHVVFSNLMYINFGLFIKTGSSF